MLDMEVRIAYFGLTLIASGISTDNLIKVMVCTDTHVGYAERDPVRGEDSFTVFEEILKHAQKNKVDFILHGGDLFHDNKPSRRALHRVTELLRKYTLGPTAPKFKIISDQSVNFHGSYVRRSLALSLPPTFTTQRPLRRGHYAGC